MNDFVVVTTYNSRIDAETAKSKLESESIKVIITSDDAGVGLIK